MRYTRIVTALVVLLVGAAGLLIAQDSIASDPTEGVGAGAMAYGLSELVKWVVPLAGSLLFSAWNKAQSAIADWSSALKAGIYIVITTALMYVGEYIDVVISNDPANWGGTFWEGLAAGLVGTLLVRIGISQARSPESATSSVATT